MNSSRYSIGLDFAEYARLVNFLGRRSDSPLKVLRNLRSEALSAKT
jgi:hypothetical protein